MLVVFAFPAVAQLIMGIAFIFLTRGPRESSWQTSFLRADCLPYIVSLSIDDIPYDLVFNLCILDIGDSSRQRVAYAYLFLIYGQDIPLGLPCAYEPSYYRHRIIPGSGPAFLLDVWTTFDLADPPENYGQGFRTILPSGPRIALDGSPAQDEVYLSRVSPL